MAALHKFVACALWRIFSPLALLNSEVEGRIQLPVEFSSTTISSLSCVGGSISYIGVYLLGIYKLPRAYAPWRVFLKTTIYSIPFYDTAPIF